MNRCFTKGTNTKQVHSRTLDKVPQVPRDVEPRNLSPTGGRRGRSQSHGAQDTVKDGKADLMKERSEELLSPNRPQTSETPESLSDSLYDSLSSCGSQG
ncbi:nck-associated protein 5-like isoform X1 [Tachysurus ichikawai]